MYVCFNFTELPIIIRPPEAVIAEVNSSIMLTCVSVGVPPPSVTFYFNDEEMKNDERIVIDKHIVTIDQVDKNDDGVYRCSATNVAGSVESNRVRVIIFGQYVCTYMYKLEL